MSDTPRTDKWYSHYKKYAVPILRELPVEKRVLYTTAVAMAADTSANLEREVAALREATIEECARVCDEFAQRIEESDSVSMKMQHHQGATYGAMLCADKIRALKGKP